MNFLLIMELRLFPAVNSYPETRHRYWNGYMLYYESSDKLKSQYGSLGDGSGLVRHDVGLRYECTCNWKNTSWHKVLNLTVRGPMERKGGIGYFSEQCGIKLRWKRSPLIVLKSVLFLVTTVPHPHSLPLFPSFIISSYFIPRSSPPSPSSSSISSSSGPPSPTRTDGLSQLTALLQKGEKKGIFKDKMPASIQRVVSSEFLFSL